MSNLTIGIYVTLSVLLYVLTIAFLWSIIDKLENEKLVKIDESNDGLWVVSTIAWPIALIAIPLFWIFKKIGDKCGDLVVWTIKEIKNPKENV